MQKAKHQKAIAQCSVFGIDTLCCELSDKKNSQQSDTGVFEKLRQSVALINPLCVLKLVSRIFGIFYTCALVEIKC